MLIVISPAKKLDTETPAPTREYSQPALLQYSQQLVDILREMDSFALAELMKLSMKLADLNMHRFQQWQPPFTLENAKQALFMFRGDTYIGLDADTLDEDDLRFAQQHLRILSGLYGLLRPLDLIQPYRLEMGTRLANPKGANLYAFWDNLITEMLNREASSPSEVLINLASNEYFKAIKPKLFHGAIITPVFKEARANGLKTIGLFAKRARGMMARYIIRHRLREPDAIQAFNEGGYAFAPELSSAREWVFVRG
ncbi:MAG: peroxide stress protein YaaA [Zetaproteobacteria bacterium]|nr:MAG: peroxide stress protein YaaA [Zetaproteobacteria bacterium]